MSDDWKLDLLNFVEVYDGHFGKNTDWPIEDFSKYINKLITLGALKIKIIDSDSFSFNFKMGGSEKLLTYLLTADNKPSEVKITKVKDSKLHKMRLEFRF